MLMTLPPGEMTELACEDCACTQFHLIAESRNGKIDTFHSRCSACGKRGALTVEVEVVQTRKFTQFADPPEGVEMGVGFSMVVGPSSFETVTTTLPEPTDK